MIQLVYHSVSAFYEDSPNLTYSLAVLIDECLRNNPPRHITGVLTFRHGEFLQILEGPDESVDTMFGRVGADFRHTQVRLLGRAPIDRRSFPGWAMGFIGYERDLCPLYDEVHLPASRFAQAQNASRLAEMLA